MRKQRPEELFERAQRGDTRSLGRLLSLSQDDQTGSAVDQLVIAAEQSAYVIGITGPPGAGKSTLTDQLITFARDEGKVAVVAIDPSSLYSGGAILGDRVRMQGHIEDE